MSVQILDEKDLQLHKILDSKFSFPNSRIQILDSKFSILDGDEVLHLTMSQVELRGPRGAGAKRILDEGGSR